MTYLVILQINFLKKCPAFAVVVVPKKMPNTIGASPAIAIAGEAGANEIVPPLELKVRVVVRSLAPSGF